MNVTMTDTATLYSLAETLKAEAKALQNIRPAESSRLFKLFSSVTEELYRRERQKSLAYKYN